MGFIYKSLRRFLTAEEVPRWFGLSIVLIYLVGLGTVAQVGIVAAREEGAERLERSSRFAVKLFAERLSALHGGGPDDPILVAAYRRALCDFAGNVTTRTIRVVDEARRVIASTNRREEGTIAPDEAGGRSPPALLEVVPVRTGGRQTLDTFIRAPVHVSGGAPRPEAIDRTAGTPRGDSGKGAAPGRPLYLEVTLPSAAGVSRGFADQAQTLGVVLVVLGALFVVYRCLRAQLRGVSRIADRLHSQRDRLEEGIEELRIGDKIDAVTDTWNQLIDLTQRLLGDVKRSDADVELSRALERSSGGALAEALHALPVGLIYIADEDRIEYVNSTASRMLGWGADATRSTVLSDAQAEGLGSEILDRLRDALRDDGSFEARTDVLTADEEGGAPSSYRMRTIPLPHARQHGECMVLIRDVSQQVRADLAREEFVTQVTHELRTPLTNIRAYAETLSSGMFDDPEVITECYNVITKETRRLSRLIEDMLSVSQLEVGSIELQIDNVDLASLISEGVRDVRALADEKNIDLQVALPSKMEPIRADRDKLAVVINNLLGNAIKYTPTDGNVVVGAQVRGSEAVITVKDNGIGIDPADHARVFEKFQRGDDPQVKSEPGTGIGLFTAREIVRRHRGDVELISEKNVGTTLIVRLPYAGSRAAARDAYQEA